MTSETNETHSSGHSTKLPIWYWVIALIGLMWFLMDMSAFFMRVLMSEEGIQAMPENQQHLYRDMPLWVNVVFAFEVFGGALGCIGLLLRKSWSLPFLNVSLIGVLSQTFHIYFMSDAISLMGAPAIMMPLLAIAICASMILLSKTAMAKQWYR